MSTKIGDDTHFYSGTYFTPERSNLSLRKDDALNIPDEEIQKYNKAKDVYGLGIAILLDLYGICDYKIFHKSLRFGNFIEEIKLDPNYAKIDLETRILIRGLLRPDVNKRLTAEQAAQKLGLEGFSTLT